MNALYATAAAPLRADPSEGVRAVLSSTEPTAHICTAGPRNLPTLCWFLATLFAIRLFRWKRFFCHFVQKPKRQQLKPFHFSGLNSRRFIGLLSPRNNRRSSKAQLKMMNNRDRWRVYKRVSVMFFLAVVGLTVVQRGSINMGAPFELGRQARMDASQGAEPGTAPEEKTDLYLGMKGFWKASKHQPVPKAPATTQEPRITEDSSPRTWDVTSSNCSANLNLSSQDWFRSLEESFKQFMLYRHCRYFPMLLNHPEKCTGDTYLLMVIKSVATQHDRREVIRKTWGKEQVVDGKRIKALFLLGKPSNEAERANHQKLVEYENYIYRDILQWDFLDSFFNLTLKETHFLKWFHIYCPSVRYVFKGDDDVFVSVENIFEFLESSNHAKNLFVGDVIFKAKPIRKKENKYYIPQALYDKTHYPPYAGGGGFLMDGTLVRRLHWVADTLELYPIDDVFLGMCLEVLQVTPIKHNAFKTFGLVKNKSSKLNREPCFFKSMIVVHKLLPSDLMHMWNLVNSDLVCSQKVEIL